MANNRIIAVAAVENVVVSVAPGINEIVAAHAAQNRGPAKLNCDIPVFVGIGASQVKTFDPGICRRHCAIFINQRAGFAERDRGKVCKRIVIRKRRIG